MIQIHLARRALCVANTVFGPYSTYERSYAVADSIKRPLFETSRWLIACDMYLYKGSILENSLLYLNGMRRPVPEPRIKQQRDGKSTAVSHPQQIFLVETVTPEAPSSKRREARGCCRAKEIKEPRQHCEERLDAGEKDVV
jgi:hypothetical protein